MLSLSSKTGLMAMRPLTWWLSELSSLLPGPGSGIRSGRWIVLSVERNGWKLIEQHGRRSEPMRHTEFASAEGGNEALARLLLAASSHGRTHKFCIRLAHSLVFEREVEVPSSATHDLHRILDLRFARGMPFRADSVYTAHYPGDASGKGVRKRYRQLVVKRELIDPAIALLERSGIKPHRIDCWDASGHQPLPVDFLQQSKAAGAGARRPRALALMTAAATLLAAGAVGAMVVRKEAALSDLNRLVSDARRTSAEHARQERRAAAMLDGEKALAETARTQTNALEVLAELTRLLPDTDHLVELRIEGETVDLSGYSASAAELVLLLEGSWLFSEARLTAPVTWDTRLSRERFGLRARIRRGDAPRVAKPGPTPGVGSVRVAQ